MQTLFPKPVKGSRLGLLSLQSNRLLPSCWETEGVRVAIPQVFADRGGRHISIVFKLRINFRFSFRHAAISCFPICLKCSIYKIARFPKTSFSGNDSGLFLNCLLHFVWFPVGWLVGWSDWLVGWLVGWLAGWSVGWLIGWRDGQRQQKPGESVVCGRLGCRG